MQDAERGGRGSTTLEPAFWEDRLVLAGVALFIVMNAVAKGVLTLMETIASPLFKVQCITLVHCPRVVLDWSCKLSYKSHKPRGLWICHRLICVCVCDGLSPLVWVDLQGTFIDTDGDIIQDTGLWFTYLGLIGLVVYAAMAIKRPKWAPSDLVLCMASMGICAIGGLVLAHPGAATLTMPTLNAGAVLIWSVGAPISDVVVVSCFSIVVQGRGQGKWMGSITM
jgi:hypothetical protein